MNYFPARLRSSILVLLFLIVSIANTFSQNWGSVGPGCPASDWFYELLSFKGKIYACGNGALVKIQRWDGTSWSYVLNIDFMGMNYPISMAVYQDALFVGGDHSLSNSDT